MVQEMLERIKKEIDEDPTGRGYKSKIPEEIARLLNESYFIERVVKEEQPNRLYTILYGISFTPNSVNATDVRNAIKEVI